MYGSSAEHLFAALARTRQRAAVLLGANPAGPAPAPGGLADLAEREREAAALSDGVPLRLSRLTATFALAPLAEAAIVALAAVEYEPDLRLLVRAAQREPGPQWIELGTLAELLDLPAPGVAELALLCSAAGPLLRHGLVELDEGEEAPLCATRLRLAPGLARFLVEDDALDPPLRLVAPRAALGDSLAAPAVVAALLAAVDAARASGPPLIVEIAGPRGVGRRHLAEGLAGALGLPLLCCDLEAVAHADVPARLRDAGREALLRGALLCLADADAPTRPGRALSAVATAAFVRVRREPLEDLALAVGVLLCTTSAPCLARAGIGAAGTCRTALRALELSPPTPRQRGRLLATALGRAGADPLDDDTLARLGRRYAVGPAALALGARAAASAARAPAEATRRLEAALRRQGPPAHATLAVRVPVARRLDDLVVAPEVEEGLRELIAHVQRGPRVLERWGFGARHGLSGGVTALFAGSPGTGKTLCAQAIAGELDLDLVRVDLSQVVSKWVGETEKNLGRLFDDAEGGGAVLLFDEADALFARRTAVTSSVDRYANLEVGYLLSRMESFSGVAILTTNFEDTIDTAFKRRLGFRLRFERPDAAARAALWRKVVPPACPLGPDVDFDRLGAAFDLSGGNIRSAALRAAFLCAEAGTAVDMAAFLTAAEREARELGMLVATPS